MTNRAFSSTIEKIEKKTAWKEERVESIKVLFLAANPGQTGRLALDEEIRLITEKIRASHHRKALEVLSAWAVRPEDLLQCLNQHRPHIVHFSGHGSSAGELLLVGAEGLPKPVSSRALSAVFQTLKDNIRLVILNACYSSVQAEAIRHEIECVVGMNAAIGDTAAILFAASFYRALGFGRSIQEAFEQGQTALLLEGIAEEQTPELLVREGSDPAQIVLVHADHAAVPRQTPLRVPLASGTGAAHLLAPSIQERGLDLVFSYAHEDEMLRQELAKHLALLKRQGLIRAWYDQEIPAGGSRREEIEAHLQTADIIVLLVSPDFIASDELYWGELELALARHRAGKARVVPIILRETEGWEQTDFGKLLALPREKQPVTAWKSRDAAFASITKDLRRLVEDLRGS